MKNQKTIVLSLLIIGMMAFSRCIADETTLRGTLERTWKAYLDASKAGDVSAFEKCQSSFQIGTTRNQLASSKSTNTSENVKIVAGCAPDIFSEKFVTLLEKGPTAGLVYMKDSEERDASKKPRVSFTLIKFVKENSAWKVDAFMNLRCLKTQADGKNTEFNPADIPPLLKIDGQVRSAPRPVPLPYAAAFLDVSSADYKTQVTVNGVEQETTEGTNCSGLLVGGLRKGTNSIVIVLLLQKQKRMMLLNPA